MWEANELYKLRKRPDGCIQVSFVFEKNRWISTKTKDEEQAKKFALKKIIERNPRSVNDITLNEWAKDFFTDKDPRGYVSSQKFLGYNIKNSTYERNQSALNNYILPAFGGKKLKEIYSSDVEKWLSRLTSKKKGTVLSTGARIAVRQTFSIVMQEAVREELIEKNPIDNVRKPKNITKEKDIFSDADIEKMFPEDLAAVVDVWGSVQFALLMSVMLDTGFRVGEAMSLGADKFYENSKGVYTSEQIDMLTGKPDRIKTAEKGAKDRVGFLSDRSIALTKLLPPENRTGRWFFLYNEKRYIPYTTIHFRLKKTCIDMGVKPRGLGCHTFRHTFMSRAEMGANHEELLRLMGHRSFRAEYFHPDPEKVLDSMYYLREKIVEKTTAQP